MSKYEIIIYWSQEDEAYIAEVPELDGCMADGASHHEALANAEVIIQEWLDTAPHWDAPFRAAWQIDVCVMQGNYEQELKIYSPLKRGLYEIKNMVATCLLGRIARN